MKPLHIFFLPTDISAMATFYYQGRDDCCTLMIVSPVRMPAGIMAHGLAALKGPKAGLNNP